jgi:hypothetical protein
LFSYYLHSLSHKNLLFEGKWCNGLQNGDITGIHQPGLEAACNTQKSSSISLKGYICTFFA